MTNSNPLSTAETTLDQIERTVVHAHYRTQIAVLALLDRTAETTHVVRAPATIRQIENYADAWAYLAPTAAEDRAALAHALGKRYTPYRVTAADIIKTLHLDDAEVRNAYQALFDAPLEDVFTVGEPDYRPDVNDDLLRRAGWRRVGRGEVVIREGEPSTHLYILVDGGLQAGFTRVTAQRPIETAVELEPGDIIGDLALWNNEPYNHTVTALRDSSLVSLTRADFDIITEAYPAVLRAIAARSVRRLRDIIQPRSRVPQTETITLLPAAPLPPGFVEQLTVAFERFGRTLYLSPAVLSRYLGREPDGGLDVFAESFEFRDWLEEQHATYRYIMLEGDPVYPAWTTRVIQQANRVAIIGFPGDLQSLCALEDLYAELPAPDLGVRRDLVVLHPRRAEQPTNTAALLRVRSVFAHHHVALDSPDDIERLARHLREHPIGIVFGGGGMRGTAHLGVMQALYELGVPVDHAGGTSAGSIVAAMVGLEWDVKYMLSEMKSRIFTRQAVMQPTLPFVSVSSARALNEAYMEMFGDYMAEDLWTPAFTIATNLTQARMEVMDHGSLHRAVRASSSLAGVHPPTIAPNNDLLIDGGGFNNTPADVMRAKLRTGTVIAVDMGFTKRQFPEYKYGDSLSGWRVLWNRLNPFRQEKLHVPTLNMVMLRANALWSIQATHMQVAQADLILRPPVSEYGLFDLESADDLFRIGYQYTLEEVSRWLDEGHLRDTIVT